MLVKQGQLVVRATTAVLLVALALQLTGCNARPVQWSELGSGGDRRPRQQEEQPRQRAPQKRQQKKNNGLIQIVPDKNHEVADLSPDDVVTIMRRIGFTDEHILVLGTDMRDALRNSGRAKVIYKGETEAIVAVNAGQVYVQSRSRGGFVHQIGGGPFGNAVPRR